MFKEGSTDSPIFFSSLCRKDSPAGDCPFSFTGYHGCRLPKTEPLVPCREKPLFLALPTVFGRSPVELSGNVPGIALCRGFSCLPGFTFAPRTVLVRFNRCPAPRLFFSGKLLPLLFHLLPLLSGFRPALSCGESLFPLGRVVSDNGLHFTLPCLSGLPAVFGLGPFEFSGNDPGKALCRDFPCLPGFTFAHQAVLARFNPCQALSFRSRLLSFQRRGLRVGL